MENSLILPGSPEEATLGWEDRLGLAWCRFNTYEWDELAGPKPEVFDRMTESERTRFVAPFMHRIENAIGQAACNRAWWLFVIGGSEVHWMRFYLTGDPGEA